MKISIDNKGKKESFNLINSWDDVTVESFARYMKYMELNGSQRSLHTLGLFTDIPKHMIKQIDVVSLGKMLSLINTMQEKDNSLYTHTFKLDGVEYGMIPDLSAITLGEYADIETFIQRGAIDNLSNIASVLFRPVIDKYDKTYTIESYDLKTAKIRAEKFKKMSATQIQAAMVFFWTFGTGLLATLGLSSEMVLQEMENK